MRNKFEISIFYLLLTMTTLAISSSCESDDVTPAPDLYVAIAAGGAHSIGIQPGGTLWTWGINTYGQIGDPSVLSWTSPIQIDTNYRAVSAGNAYSLGLKADNTVWAWGSNRDCQLGK